MQQDDIINSKESTYRNEVNKALQKESSNHNYLAEQKRKQAKERQQTMLRILTGVLLLLVAVIALVRNRKTKP